MTTPQSLTLSESDVRQGYVDVASPLEVTVRSNVPEGYVLAWRKQGELVREAMLHGLRPRWSSTPAAARSRGPRRATACGPTRSNCACGSSYRLRRARAFTRGHASGWRLSIQ